MTLKFFRYLSVLLIIAMAVHLAGIAGPVLAASKETLVEKGNALFDKGDYDGALRAYEEAAVFDPESPRILFNKGTALYKKEDYSAAKDAFQQSALKSKEIALETKARFNAGLCFFKQGERQKDSDLNKTLEAYGASIQAFQESLKLNPDFTEAAENIELVRLMMKSVLDEIKKKEEAARNQQEEMRKQAEKINDLIEKQTDLIKESRKLLEKSDSGKAPAAKEKKNIEIADAQDRLKQETENLSDELAKQGTTTTQGPGNTGDAAVPPAKQHLDTSAYAQENAVTRLEENDIPAGADYQKQSLFALEEALKAMNGSQNEKTGQQQASEKETGPQQQPAGDESPEEAADSGTESGRKPDNGEAGQNNDPPDQTSAFELADDPDSILEEEKQNNKQRTPVSTGKFREVDKDW